jgi:hypothetical protein
MEISMQVTIATRIGPRNRMSIHFVSHKLGCLLMPFALMLMAGSIPQTLSGRNFESQAIAILASV